MKDHSITVLGVRFHPLTSDEILSIVQHTVERRGRARIANVNVYGMNLAFEQIWLRDFFNHAEVVFCDGAGVALAAQILGHPPFERVTYADWMWQVGALAAARGFTLFLLGAKEDIAEKAAEKLRERFPTVKIVGTHHGYFNHVVESEENQRVLQRINTAAPDILVLGFGMPLQERWLMENWDALNARVGLTGGAVFDYVSGTLRRGPSWMTDNGLEWLARLIIEPRRLWRRYLIGNPLFFWRVLRQKFRQGQ